MAREITGRSKNELLPLALTVVAFGALAIGVLVIGRLAVGRLVVKNAHFRELEVDALTVRKLRIVADDRPK